MNDARSVSGTEGLRGVAHVPHGSLPGDGPSLEHILERLTVEQLHGVETTPLRSDPKIVNLNQSGVTHPGQRARFRTKLLACRATLHSDLRHELERNRAAQVHVAGFPHFAHPATREPTCEAVTGARQEPVCALGIEGGRSGRWFRHTGA